MQLFSQVLHGHCMSIVDPIYPGPVSTEFRTSSSIWNIPQHGTRRPWTTWLPLGIVLGVSLIKEAIEDYKRYKADVEVNNREVEVLNHETNTFQPKRWKDIMPGEIVEVVRDTFFPADLLFLTAENEEGVCYIETMNLDG